METDMPDTSKIKEHMEVLASDGRKVGLVDHMEGSGKIKLTMGSTGHGHHHLIPVSWVERVDRHVHLNKTGDYVAQNWEHGH
jgi:hypothetical protein